MTRNQCLVIFAAALTLRFGNFLLLPAGEAGHFMDDSRAYWLESERLLTEGWFYWWDGTVIAFIESRPPLYFFFLAGIRAVAGASVEAVALVQIVIDAATCVLIGLLAGRIDRRLILWAGLLAAVWPNLIVHSALLLTDTPFLLLFTASLVLAWRAAEQAEPLQGIAAGLAFGLAVVTRNVVQFLYLPAIALVALCDIRRRPGRACLTAALFAATAALPAGLLIARNMTVHGVATLTAQTGPHLLNWVLPEVRYHADGTMPDLSRAQHVQIIEERREALARAGKPADVFEVDRMMRDLAIERLAELPAGAFVRAWAGGMAANLLGPPVVSDPRVRALPKPSLTTTPGDGFADRILNYLSAADGGYLWAMLLGLTVMACLISLQAWGAIAMLRVHPFAALLGLALVAYVLLITGPVIGPKYRLPAEPVLIVFAAWGMRDIVARFGRRIPRTP